MGIKVLEGKTIKKAIEYSLSEVWILTDCGDVVKIEAKIEYDDYAYTEVTLNPKEIELDTQLEIGLITEEEYEELKYLRAKKWEVAKEKQEREQYERLKLKYGGE